MLDCNLERNPFFRHVATISDREFGDGAPGAQIIGASESRVWMRAGWETYCIIAQFLKRSESSEASVTRPSPNRLAFAIFHGLFHTLDIVVFDFQPQPYFECGLCQTNIPTRFIDVKCVECERKLRRSLSSINGLRKSGFH
jgi:hypothetical protein